MQRKIGPYRKVNSPSVVILLSSNNYESIILKVQQAVDAHYDLFVEDNATDRPPKDAVPIACLYEGSVPILVTASEDNDVTGGPKKPEPFDQILFHRLALIARSPRLLFGGRKRIK